MLELSAAMTFVDALGRDLSLAGISKKDFALVAGIPASTIYNWFSARGSEPSVELARKAAKARGTTIEGLIARFSDRSESAGEAILAEGSGSQWDQSPTQIELRHRLGLLLDRLGDADLRVVLGMVTALTQERHAEDLQSGSGS